MRPLSLGLLGICWAFFSWLQSPTEKSPDLSADCVDRVVSLRRILSSDNVRPGALLKEIPGTAKQSSPDTIEIRSRSVTTLVRTSGTEGAMVVQELEMHFDLKVRLKLKQLTEALGPSSMVSEGETSSIVWNENPESGARVYAVLFSSKVTQDSLVISVRIRPPSNPK